MNRSLLVLVPRLSVISSPASPICLFLAALRICLWADPQRLPSSPHICQPHLIYDNASSSSFHLCFSWRSAKEHLSTIRRRHLPLPSMRSTQGQWMGMSFSSRPTPAGAGLMVCTARRCFPIGGANKLMNATRRQKPPRTSIRSWSHFIITLAVWPHNEAEMIGKIIIRFQTNFFSSSWTILSYRSLHGHLIGNKCEYFPIVSIANWRALQGWLTT